MVYIAALLASALNMKSRGYKISPEPPAVRHVGFARDVEGATVVGLLGTAVGALEEGANEIVGGAVVGTIVGDDDVGVIVGYEELEQTLPSLLTTFVNKGHTELEK